MMKKVIAFLSIFITFSVSAQEELTLDKCYELLNQNFPIIRQNILLEQKNELEMSVIKKARLPVLDFSAQATYQSDVTEVPVNNPLVQIEPPNKDQYKAQLMVNQLIYNGSKIKIALEAKSTELLTQQKQIEVSMHQIKKQINQLYFSILLTQEKGKLLDQNKELLDAKLKEVRSAIKYGAILPASDNVLEAELLKVGQLTTSNNQTKQSLIKSLALLIGTDINQNIALQNEELSIETEGDINRPELDLFQLQKQQIQTSEKLISRTHVPRIFGFGTLGIGNPGLNFLDNTFQPYYMVGLKLNWSILDWNATKKKRQAILINKDIIDTQQEVFELNTNIELLQQQSEISKVDALIVSDNQIIDLRKKILVASDSQLKNGVITSSAYITELTHLYDAESNLSVHKIQLQLYKANYITIKGNNSKQ